MNDLESDLPNNWAIVKFGELITLNYGKGLTKKNREQGTIPVYGSNGIVGYHSKALIEEKSIVVGRKGSVGAVHRTIGSFWPIDTTYYTTLSPALDFDYSYYLLLYLKLDSLDKSTTIPGLNRNDAYALDIPVAPLLEQKRIVFKIDKLFSSLDTGEKLISESKLKTEQYRSSLHRSAFRGDLTKKWRESNQAPLVKYSETRPEWLPDSWTWRKIGDIAEVASGSTPSTADKENFGGDYPWLTPADLSDFPGKFIERGARNLSKKGLDSCSAKMLPEGTILFSSRAPIGYVAVAKNPISTNQGFKNLILSEGVFNEFVFYYLKGNKQLVESYASGTTFLEVSASRMRKIPIPIPPLPEQEKIVEMLDSAFSVIDATRKDHDQSLIGATKLREIILKNAFEGELVPQNPDDEPTEELLEKIKRVHASSA